MSNEYVYSVINISAMKNVVLYVLVTEITLSMLMVDIIGIDTKRYHYDQYTTPHHPHDVVLLVFEKLAYHNDPLLHSGRRIRRQLDGDFAPLSMSVLTYREQYVVN